MYNPINSRRMCLCRRPAPGGSGAVSRRVPPHMNLHVRSALRFTCASTYSRCVFGGIRISIHNGARAHTYTCPVLTTNPKSVKLTIPPKSVWQHPAPNINEGELADFSFVGRSRGTRYRRPVALPCAAARRSFQNECNTSPTATAKATRRRTR